MPTLRDQLVARRNQFVQRVVLFDDVLYPPQYDSRLAFTRRFFEGGDDVRPECLQNGKSPPRRPPPPLKGDEYKLAKGHLDSSHKDVYSESSDWDWFVTDSVGGNTPERILLRLGWAVDLFQKGVKLEPGQIFDLKISRFPTLDESGNSVSKAWAYLYVCGSDPSRMEAFLNALLAPVKSAADGLKNDDLTRLTNELWRNMRDSFDDFLNKNPPYRPNVPSPPPEPVTDLPDDCLCQRLTDDEKRIREFLKHAGERRGSIVSIQRDVVATSLPSKEDPAKDPQKDLNDATAAAADALFAAVSLEPPEKFVSDLRNAHVSDGVITELLKWIASEWNNVPAGEKWDSASNAWQYRHYDQRRPEYSDPNLEDQIYPNSFQNKRWHDSVAPAVAAIVAAAAALRDLDNKPVRTVCVAIARSTWPGDDDVPFGKKLVKFLGLSGESGKKPFFDKLHGDEFRAAADRTESRDDCPFRLAALMMEPEAYMRVLDGLPPSAETGSGANRMARPTADPVSAYYWANVIVPSTFGHLVGMKDTADFHTVSQTRLIGFFRPGGRLHPLPSNDNPADPEFEHWLFHVLPPWVIDLATACLLRFKYWIEDAWLEAWNSQEMPYWSENHQVNFASSEYILGRWFPDEIFTWTGKNGEWHHKRALDRLETWLRRRLSFGFSEVDSGTYYNQHLPPLLNIIDFATSFPDDETKDAEGFRIRRLAVMVTDLMVFDIVRRACRGSFVAASGRAYYTSKSSGWSVSITNFIEILTGMLGDFTGPGEPTALNFAMSDYLQLVPECLIALGMYDAEAIVDRSRTSINLEDGEKYGIQFDSSADLIFWWGCGAYFTEQTWTESQAWSHRWHLRDTGPFKLFNYVDKAWLRLVEAVLGLVESIPPLQVTVLRQAVLTTVVRSITNSFAEAAGYSSAGAMTSVGDYPAGMLNLALLGPLLVRRVLDVLLAIVDLIIEIVANVLKGIGWEDDSTDRLRVARPTFEQMFRGLAIEFNAGSVLGRQRVYGWRGADAALSSLIDDHKGKTSAQKETCIAVLGPNVSVYTGKPLKTDYGNVLDIAGQALEGYGRGLTKFAYDPETIFTSQFDAFGGQPAPEMMGAMTPILGALASEEAFGDDGPGHWFGSISAPLVFQHENVAIAIYKPSAEQKDLTPEYTHVHWPWDHFDQVEIAEACGGKWVFGRRDRRFPPRTPCEPKNRPTQDNPWPAGARRMESEVGSGYVAVFSANGLKTLVPDGGSLKADGSFQPGNWGHKELIADGHENIFVLVVGDRNTYGTFEAFRKDVLASSLTVSVDNGTCSITMPLPGNSGNGPKLESSWKEGGKFDGAAIDADSWPRFELTPSTIPAGKNGAAQGSSLVTGFRLFNPQDASKKRVDWDDTAWRIEVTVSAFELQDDGSQQRVNVTLHLEHGFEKEGPLRRDANGLAPNQSLMPFPHEKTGIRAVSHAAVSQDFRSQVRSTFRREARYGKSH